MEVTAGTAFPPRPEPRNEPNLQALVNTRMESSYISQTDRRRRKLEDAYEKLNITWGKFSSHLTPDQNIEIGAKPDLNALLQAVEEKNTKYQEKRTSTKIGKIRKVFSNVVLWLEDHKDLLSVIPSDDKYVSLVAGSILIISKATINHEKAAQVISDSFDDLHEDLDYWRRQMNVHRTNHEMQYFIIEIYVIIFEMFTDVFTKWLSSRLHRMMTSFNTSWLKDHFLDRRAQIKLLKERLENEAKLSTERRIVETERMMTVMLAHFQTVLGPSHFRVDVQSSDIATMDVLLTSLMEQSSAISKQQLIDQPDRPLDRLCQAAKDNKNVTNSDTETILWSSSIASADTQRELIVDDEVYTELETWIKSNTSGGIWLEGSYDVEAPSHNTCISSVLAAITKSAKIPVIHWFSADLESEMPQTFSPESTFLTIIQNLIRQMRPLVENNTLGLAELDLGITEMNNKKASLSSLLDILRELIDKRPSMLICYIDNIQIAEDLFNVELQNNMHRFLKMLLPGTHAQGEHQAGILKTCFTTDGFSSSLGDMARDELLQKVVNEVDSDELDSGKDLNDLL